MNRYAAEQGFLVAYPEQPVAHHLKKCWNWYEPAHQSAGRGEPAIIAGIVRQVAGEFPVDPERIYIGGISAGGAMAVVVALAYPDIFAAVGSHSGVGWKVASDVMSGLAAMQGRGPAPGESAALAWEAMGATRRFVPLIVFHGGSDKVVNPAATDLLVNQFVTLRGLSGSKVRVDSLPDAGGGRSYLLLRFQDADGRTAIEQWFVPELGHALSGGSAEGTWTDPSGPDAAREMLRFFLEHPRGEH
jgi:poly(hydroxyalkanoate) depolymerase family esterase